MRLAHVGDIHSFRLLAPPLSLLSKRILGQTNLWFNRRRRFRNHLLDPLLARVAAIRPDLVLFSGDLTTTALPSEFESVAIGLRKWLEGVPALAVPGNHDRYTFASAWKNRMEQALPGTVPEQFPHLRSIAERWFLLALDSAVPRIWSSRGRLGLLQLSRAQSHIEKLTEGQGLIVLCHYPFVAPPRIHMKWGHRLADAGALQTILESCKARVLYLHGHVHQSWVWQSDIEGMAKLIDVNAGAACQIDSSYPHGQGFWEINLPDNPTLPVRIRRHVLRVEKPDESPATEGEPLEAFLAKPGHDQTNTADRLAAQPVQLGAATAHWHIEAVL